MEKPIDHYWTLRLRQVQKVLEKNHFDAYITDSPHQARKLALDTIIPDLNPTSLSWGGSMTFTSTELYNVLKNNEDLDIIDTYDKSVTPEEGLDRRKQALFVDLFITGTNALTEDGRLVNLDMIGNRVGALTFGPKNVLLFVGRNKIVPDIPAAMQRIKNYTAPVNAMRLDKKTPCVKTARCEECSSPDRICNTWSIIEKSFPRGRIKIVMINADMGL
ncbi:MAG: lactate utilization protein [Desulfobacteraceae bacterium]|nr:lactate utilization protein [Desulfobacteraceae bacterium]